MSRRFFKPIQVIGWILLLLALSYLGYTFLVEKSNRDLKAAKKTYTQDIKIQDQVLKDLEVEAAEVLKNQEERTQAFIKDQGFHPNQLNSLSLKDELVKYRKAQEEITKELQDQVKEDFKQDFYEEDDMAVFLGKYSDLSSSSRSEKHQGNLWEELNASAVLDLILKDPLYGQFNRDNPTGGVALKTGILHQAYLGYDLYKLTNIKLKNVDDLCIAYELYVHGLESLQKEGFQVQAFHLEKLQENRKKFQASYKEYLKYEGIINQLEELQNEDKN